MNRALALFLSRGEKALRGHAQSCGCPECVETADVIGSTVEVIAFARDGAKKLRQGLRKSARVEAVEVPSVASGGVRTREPLTTVTREVWESCSASERRELLFHMAARADLSPSDARELVATGMDLRSFDALSERLRALTDPTRGEVLPDDGSGIGVRVIR